MKNLTDIMIEQWPTVTGWICPKCRQYKGKLKCGENILICWVGADMSGCRFFIEERRKNESRKIDG